MGKVTAINVSAGALGHRLDRLVERQSRFWGVLPPAVAAASLKWHLRRALAEALSLADDAD